MVEKVEWRGGSGKIYTYSLYDIDWNPKGGQDGNYIFAKQIDDVWLAVYVGEGDLKDRKAAHIRDGCVNQKGATHYHCHLKAIATARSDEEADILTGNPEAYAPTGCNVKVGG